MAGVKFTLGTEGTVATGTALKTILQAVAAANHRVLLKGFGISFDGASPTGVPILVNIQRQTGTGTGGSAVTARKKNEGDNETVQTTGLKGPAGTWTAEPTAGEIVRTYLVHPQSGQVEYFPFGEEIPVIGGNRCAIVVTAPAGVNAAAFFDCDE